MCVDVLDSALLEPAAQPPHPTQPPPQPEQGSWRPGGAGAGGSGAPGADCMQLAGGNGAAAATMMRRPVEEGAQLAAAALAEAAAAAAAAAVAGGGGSPDLGWVPGGRDEYGSEGQNIVSALDERLCVVLPPWAVRAGPRRQIFFDPQKVNAAVVASGHVCPGINDVVQGIVHRLTDYGVREESVLGIVDGFDGFDPRIAHHPALQLGDRHPRPLGRKEVEGAHLRGGSMLGTSRGWADISSVVSKLEMWDINMLFIVGGDGGLRAGQAPRRVDPWGNAWNRLRADNGQPSFHPPPSLDRAVPSSSSPASSPTSASLSSSDASASESPWMTDAEDQPEAVVAAAVAAAAAEAAAAAGNDPEAVLAAAMEAQAMAAAEVAAAATSGSEGSGNGAASRGAAGRGSAGVSAAAPHLEPSAAGGLYYEGCGAEDEKGGEVHRPEAVAAEGGALRAYAARLSGDRSGGNGGGSGGGGGGGGGTAADAVGERATKGVESATRVEAEGPQLRCPEAPEGGQERFERAAAQPRTAAVPTDAGPDVEARAPPPPHADAAQERPHADPPPAAHHQGHPTSRLHPYHEAFE
ncbi:6-phosphofructokinase 5, chloroplastic [Tetrabaena socialis]|uniref:6-phosphofructokinase 5, chloroplastic n=1 Tax=Tetrabaena socialis TaxID=47790 RepID=A0A2J7ZUD3_9CHLO|nr:6-phosphofructokinase 5, chloroplastic [Tetrabaena socialis]|eukprot:PNH03887.1 6-phosphofructokinase 5, chloroplastic [Tetrabaena socialis]